MPTLTGAQGTKSTTGEGGRSTPTVQVPKRDVGASEICITAIKLARAGWGDSVFCTPRRVATRSSRPPTRAAARDAPSALLKENEIPEEEPYDNSSRKKRKRNAPPSAFLDPFAETIEKPASPMPPPRTWTVVPPEQITYGYTPSQTPSQLEMQPPMIPEASADFLEPSQRDNFIPDFHQSSHVPVIDPRLEEEDFSDSFNESPHNQAGPLRSMSEAPSAPSETPLYHQQRPIYQKPHSVPSRHPTNNNTQSQPRFSTPALPVHDPPAAFSPQRALKTSEQVSKKFASEIEDLDGENHQLLHRMDALEELLEHQTATIDRLFESLENNEGTVGASKVSKGKGTRDNALNGAIRKVFLVAMGLPKTAKYKDAALLLPVKQGGSYIPDPATPNGTLLRPDWKISFNDNSVWHAAMIKCTRQKVPTITPAISRAAMDDKSEDEILDRLASVFRNVSAEYRKAPKPQPSELTIENTPDADPKRTNRRKGRKVRKSEECVKVLQAAGVKVEQEWDWLLTPAYQSTDVLDPDTDIEKAEEIPVKSTRKPWLSRTPMYRSDAVGLTVL
ncbi:hypothetical protein C8F04DRAFT_1186384 [Mycena alexandri]|uniref:Uncharacterized protein n=1 Tax=Mycena alexandri TaxID=1745969 RepID=A0AAD6X046_9AGAR|nr:hypothetical protein C8F04DRAFT_1186384 [Mycena alexandri]